MNAATRAALQKKKRELASTRHAPISIDVAEIREATKRSLEKLLLENAVETKPKPEINLKAKDIARKIEESLNHMYSAHTPAYKSSFRRLFAGLKSKSSDFKEKLLEGELDPHEYATKSADELKTPEQKTRDEKLKQQGIDQSVAKQLLPENVNQIKDGRDREKWGVSRSAAAIDD